MQVVSRPVVATLATVSVLLLGSACGSQASDDSAAAPSDPPAASVAADEESTEPSGSPSPSTSASASASASPSPSASASASASPSKRPTGSASPKRASGTKTEPTKTASKPPAAPSFPVPVSVGNATQLITVRASGSYATVTAWQKGSAGWKAQFSTTAGRVGSNGVTNGSTRRQNTYTTPNGTYTLTEGFGVQAGGTAMPYTVVNSTHWWVEDPESKYYNQMHSAAGADFP